MSRRTDRSPAIASRYCGSASRDTNRERRPGPLTKHSTARPEEMSASTGSISDRRISGDAVLARIFFEREITEPFKQVSQLIGVPGSPFQSRS